MNSIRQRLLIVPIVALLASFCLGQTNTQLIKERIVAELMTTHITDSQIEGIIARINNDGSFGGINYEDLSRTASFPHGGHTRDLVYMAKAYKNKTSKYYRNELLKKRIISGLDYWVKHDFVGDNWHDNQITTPTNLGNLMLVVGVGKRSPRLVMFKNSLICLSTSDK